MNLWSFKKKKNKFLTHNHPLEAQIRTTIYFQIYCSNFSSLRSYNYPPRCAKTLKACNSYFFIFSPQSISPPHLQLNADKRVKHP